MTKGELVNALRGLPDDMNVEVDLHNPSTGMHQSHPTTEIRIKWPNDQGGPCLLTETPGDIIHGGMYLPPVIAIMGAWSH